MAHSPGRPRDAFVELDPVPTRQVTFLISDVECFTQLTERLGDHAALALMNRYHTMVRQAVAEHQGEEVELHGDGLVLAFDCPVRAVCCAVAMQQSLARARQELPLRVRMGLHSGLALLHGNIYFGRTLIVACRIASFARARQILVSDQVRDRVERRTELRCGNGFDVWLKGFREPHRICEVAWDEAAGAARRAAPAAHRPGAHRVSDARSRFTGPRSAAASPSPSPPPLRLDTSNRYQEQEPGPGRDVGHIRHPEQDGTRSESELSGRQDGPAPAVREVRSCPNRRISGGKEIRGPGRVPPQRGHSSTSIAKTRRMSSGQERRRERGRSSTPRGARWRSGRPLRPETDEEGESEGAKQTVFVHAGPWCGRIADSSGVSSRCS